jgi:hypothetical protein
MGRKKIIIYQCYLKLTEVLALMTPRCRQADKLAASAVTAAAAISPPPRYRRPRAIASTLLPRCPSPSPCCHAAAVAAATALPLLLPRRCLRCRAAATNAALPPPSPLPPR